MICPQCEENVHQLCVNPQPADILGNEDVRLHPATQYYVTPCGHRVIPMIIDDTQYLHYPKDVV